MLLNIRSLIWGVMGFFDHQWDASFQRCNRSSSMCSPCSKAPPQNIYNLYNQVGINCFIAAAIYVVVGAVSLCQVRLNKRQEYMVT